MVIRITDREFMTLGLELASRVQALGEMHGKDERGAFSAMVRTQNHYLWEYLGWSADSKWWGVSRIGSNELTHTRLTDACQTADRSGANRIAHLIRLIDLLLILSLSQHGSVILAWSELTHARLTDVCQTTNWCMPDISYRSRIPADCTNPIW